MTTQRQKKLFIALQMHGETLVHVNGGLSDYATACGLAAEGTDGDGGEDVPLPPRPKIDCTDCKYLFDLYRNYRAGDFE